MPSAVRVAPAIAALTVVAPVPQAQAPITTPQAHFGFNFGDDYQLANYRQLADYWRTLDVQSDRLVVREIGKTSDGRPHLMAIVT